MSIDHRAEAEAARERARHRSGGRSSPRQLLLEIPEPFRRYLEQFARLVLAQAQRLEHGLCGLAGRLARAKPQRRPTFDARPVEEALCGRHGCEGGRLRRASGFAPDHDRVRVAAELRDVVVHPPQRGCDIQHPGRSRGGVLLTQQVAQVQVSHDAQAVIVGDHDDVVITRQRGPVVHRVLRGDVRAAIARRKASSVRVEHDRPLPAIADALCPHIQEQAVLAGDRRLPLLWPVGIGRLNRLRAVEEGVPDATPRFERRRRFEAVRACRGSRVPGCP